MLNEKNPSGEISNIKNSAGIRNNYFLKAFLLGLALSFLLFIPYIIKDGGRFLFYGDFNVQQVPFYRIAHDAVLSGNLGWNHLTDLGANFVGSYSFYLLGSPFFWLTIPFPGEWLQFLMGPLLMLKFACATLTAYIFLKRYVKNQNYAIIGAILYAFSGFSVYNVFFNHFHEAIVFFPLLMAALDEYMATRRRGIFALAVFACVTVNYYFFVGQVVFVCIYFFIRLACKSWKISIKDFLLLALESVIGFGLSCVLILPAVFATLQNSRINNSINGWDALLYNKPQRYVHILQSLFFPPDLPARPNFTPDSGSKWASIGAWLPLFGMTGVIGWLQLQRKHWLKKIIYVLFACALIPVLNSAFQMFNASYYARWFYILTMMMSLATIMALENTKTNWRRSIKWSAIITAIMSIAIGAMPKETTTDGVTSISIGLEDYPTRFWSYAAISFICLAVLTFLFSYLRNNSTGNLKESENKFVRGVMLSLSITAVLYSSFFIAIGKTQSSDPYNQIIPYALNGGKDLTLDNLDSVRSDFYESLDNSGMFWKIPTIQAFHSIVPGSVMDFYKYIGVQRDVASRPETSHYALRGITSTRWLFDDDNDDEYFAGKEYDTPEMPGWVYYGNENGFDIWENEYYIPMGFSYDSYITEEEITELSESSRELLMLKTAIIPKEDEEKWSSVVPKFDLKTAKYDKDNYFSDCLARSRESSNSFSYTRTGFDSIINPKNVQMVFFSVPYEDGWKATVNGEPAEILKTNKGFMSVRVPEGEEVRIAFTYTTPYLYTGILITIISALLFIAYIVVMRSQKIIQNSKKKKLPLRKCGKFSSYCKNFNITFKMRTIRGNMRSRFN